MLLGQPVFVLDQPMERTLRVEHPVVLVAVWQPPLEEVVQVVERVLEPQLSAPPEQLFVVEAQVTVSGPLAVCDDDRWPLDSPHSAAEHTVRVVQVLEVADDEP